MKKRTVVLALCAIALAYGCAFSLVWAQPTLPVNPDVTQETLEATVCTPGWAASVRPPASFTNRIKAAKMAALGLPASASARYELDHVISIVLGGAPRDAANLRVQEWYGAPVETPAGADGLDTQAHAKDVLEVRLHRLVCAGQLELREAQECIYRDWRACAATYPKEGKTP